MPDLPEGSEYLVAFLHSAGTATATGFGLTGLSWQEIYAWVRCTDNVGIASSRDLKLIHMLSRVYANEYARASKKGVVRPPYEPTVVLVKETREAVAKKADDIFAELINFQTRK